ncbi:helix-turn-helix transcriptional regulator [Catelliglobosispora koreensis]|uniref:helix-turn-helix transcriptional regulator n=1 Tax=Catelliglobosispora koreensis TaxID=129052 RepID=UPI0003730D40|nr:LuxR family transcriptional regulator [Catelliglobosispora koreensis]
MGHTDPAGLCDRVDELKALQEAVRAAAAAAGEGQFVALEGAAGIGKTRLLAEAAAMSATAGATVRRARGSELEQNHSYGLVRQLFDPLLAEAGETQRQQWLSGPAAQATAAVGHETLAAQPVGDFAVLHGLYWLTLNVCQDKPLALICDDLHWADESSLRFLAHLLPRLSELPVIVLATLRPGAATGENQELLDLITTDPACVTLRPRPLSVDSVAMLISEVVSAQADPAFAASCHEACGGNPLLVLECAETARAQGIAPVAGNQELITTGTSDMLTRRVRGWLRTLPGACVKVCEAVAVLGDSATITNIRGLTGLSEPEVQDAVRRLQAADILASENAERPEVCGFVHPLVRTAIYTSIAPGDLFAGHRRAWRLLSDSGDSAEAVAAHLLQLPPADSLEVADGLARAAAEALARGANRNAYRYLERALAEQMPSGRRLELLKQAQSVARAVDLIAFVACTKDAYELETEPLEKARLAADLGVGLLRAGQFNEGKDYFSRSMDLLPAEEQDVRRRCLAALSIVSIMVPPDRERLSFLEQCLALPPAATYGGKLLDAVLSMWKCQACDPSAVARARRALQGGLLDFDVAPEAVPAIWITLIAADAPETIGALNDAVAQVHEHGSSTGAAVATMFRALAWLARGALADAEADAREALALIEATHVESARHHALTILTGALIEQGRIDEAAQVLARTTAPEMMATLEHHPSGYITLLCLARLRRAQGDHTRAYDSAMRVGHSEEARGGTNPAVLPWRTEAALNLIALGRREEAAGLAAGELDGALRWKAPGPIGRARHVLGLARAGDQGIELMTQAVAELATSSASLDHARALFDLGTALRRSGHRGESRMPLGRAVELAQQCGAAPLLEKATTELLAAGGHPGKHANRIAATLTPSEQRVAELAATGLSNRQIAQELFITPKTVEVHLGNAYRKLNVNSRHQLKEKLPSGAPEGS